MRGNAQASRYLERKRKVEQKEQTFLKPENYYLRLSVTDGCNLGCTYCDCASAVAKTRLPMETLEKSVRFLGENIPINKIRFTGGEPLINPDLINIIDLTRNIFPESELSLTTNGILLAGMAGKLREAGLKRINISIDSVDENIYREITEGGQLQRVLQGVKAAVAEGFDPIKLNCVILKNRNSRGMVNLIKFAAEYNCQIRFIELMPVGQSEEFFNQEYLSSSEAIKIISQDLKLVGTLGLKSTSREYLIEAGGKEVTVGFISSVSLPFCSDCNRIRLDSEGNLITCLRKSSGLNIPGLLKEFGKDEGATRLKMFLEQKSIPDKWYKRPMISIGG